ncbi:MAG: beta-eliminating lyase-related protein, partial [Shewanella sp.]
RVANAAVAQNIPISAITAHFDSVSICLSKGLCAPVGSLLLGDERFITKAKRWRKMLGGGMRQAGILAAAGKLALTEQVQRLSDDHDNARYLAEQLAQLAEFDVDVAAVQTNMVFATLAAHLDANEFAARCRGQGILLSPGRTMRFVTHKDICRQDIDKVLRVVKSQLMA